MTAVVAATLIEDSILSWKTRPSDVFDELQDTINDEYQNITLTDFLSHQSGIEPFYSDRLFDIYTLYPFITGTKKEQRKK